MCLLFRTQHKKNPLNESHWTRECWAWKKATTCRSSQFNFFYYYYIPIIALINSMNCLLLSFFLFFFTSSTAAAAALLSFSNCMKIVTHYDAIMLVMRDKIKSAASFDFLLPFICISLCPASLFVRLFWKWNRWKMKHKISARKT